MKLFLKNIILFCGIAFCLLVFTFFLLNYINNKAFSNYRVNPNVTSLFIGDSHVQLSVNDQQLLHSVNLAQSSETIFFTYFKIKTILENNPSIKKVYIGYGYHNISSCYDYYGYLKENSARYFFILPFGQKKVIIKQNIKELPGVLQSIFINGFKTLFGQEKDYSFLGRYENNYKNISVTKGATDKRILQQYYKDGKLRDFSLVNIQYLGKIIDVCKQANVEVFILNAPIHPYYKSKIPPEFIAKYNEVITAKKLPVIDFKNLLLTDDCFLPDGDHVSQKGAILTTAQIKE